MPAMFVAAAIVSVSGLAAALALVAIRHLHDTPHLFDAEHLEWPYSEVDYLWWDEGIHWAAR